MPGSVIGTGKKLNLQTDRLDETTALMLIETETSLSQRRNESVVYVSCTNVVQILAITAVCFGHTSTKKSNDYKHLFELPNNRLKKEK